MKETKECQKCNKLMIKWRDLFVFDQINKLCRDEDVWKCFCGHKELFEHKTFEQAWEEENK